MATIDINQVGTFIRVVEAGSFTAAAAQLGLPKSSVSRGVSRLEEGLGVRLLQRTTRKLHLTDAGQRYFQQARMALAGLEEANKVVGDMGREARGTVRITTPVDFGQDMFAEMLATFVRLHPLIHIDVIMTARRVDLVAEGVDLALRAGVLDDSSLVARRVVATSLRLFASPGYLERRGRPRRLADLVKHDCLILKSSQGPAPWRLSGARGYETVRVSGPIVVDDLRFVLRLALAGVGIALLPDMATDADVARGTLVPVLPAYSAGGASLYVVSPPLRHVPARVALLRDYLLAELPRLFATTARR